MSSQHRQGEEGEGAVAHVGRTVLLLQRNLRPRLRGIGRGGAVVGQAADGDLEGRVSCHRYGCEEEEEEEEEEGRFHESRGVGIALRGTIRLSRPYRESGELILFEQFGN